MTTKEQVKYIEGSKGCFPAYALVSTPKGAVPIKDIKIGDDVVSFDHSGQLHISKVTGVVEHEKDVVYRISFWGGKIDVTGNHWMLNQYNAFVPAISFEVDDAFVNHDGHLVPITGKERLNEQKVYNLHVETNHTFICDGIRVHNGGIGQGHYGQFISGNKGGGKGGGGTYTPKEAANTLKAVSIARVLDLISEGEVRGLVNGMQSIYFNETALQNADGSFNFSGVTVHTRNGTPDQDYVEGFPSTENEIAVGVQVKSAFPTVRTITDENISAASVKIRIPSLTKQSTNGDLNGSTVQFKISVQSNGGGYVDVIDTTINGKTTSPYESAYRVPLPEGGSPWDIKVTRITPDNTGDASLTNDTYWSTYTRIIDNKIRYVDSALVGVEIDAEQFAEQVPSRAYDMYGLLLQVPVNYDPETRTYTGLWNGAFKTAWTDNPAWFLYGLLTNKRWGIGSSINSTQVDKFALYDIAQYCDTLVPDGKGGLEPRYTFNGIINTTEEAYKVLYSVVSNFRGMLYFSSGLVTAVADRDSDVVKLVTPANVENGSFTYTGGSLKTLKSVAIVRYNDPEDGFKSAVIAYEDPDLIRRFGWRVEEIPAYGCTSKGQAYRTGKWFIETQNQSEMVSYRTGFDHADVKPGDIIEVMDPDYAGVRYGGRIISYATGAVTIDQAITLEVGEEYRLNVVMGNGLIEERLITTPSDGGDHSLLTLDSEFDGTPINGAMWTVSASNLEPRKFRVITISETDKHMYEVAAIIHDPTKYARVEENINLEPINYTLLPQGKLKAPTDLSLSEYLYLTTNGVPNSAITVSWTASADPRARLYVLEIKRPNLTFWEPIVQTSGNTADLTGLAAGVYEFRVKALDPYGQESSYYTESFSIFGLNFPPSDVTTFRINNVGSQSNLTWNHVPDLDLDYYVIKYSNKVSNAAWGESIPLAPRIPAGATYFTVPTLIGSYLIKAVDKNGNESVNACTVVSNISDINQNNIVMDLSNVGFAGAKTNVTLTGTGYIRLTDLSLEGIYEFADGFDLGDVYTSRVVPYLDAKGEDTSNTMDTWVTLSSIAAMESSQPSEWMVRIQISISQDNVNWTPWEDIIIGDYTCRAFKFRLILKSLNGNTSPTIYEAGVIIDMPDREEVGVDIPTGVTGIKTITYSYPFKEKPSVQINPQDMQPGDTWSFITKDEFGFEIKFVDSTNTAVDRTFDYSSKSYGRKL